LAPLSSPPWEGRITIACISPDYSPEQSIERVLSHGSSRETS
jgi:hypothetical protein